MMKMNLKNKKKVDSDETFKYINNCDDFKKVRLQLQFSAEKFAKFLSVSRQTINNIELRGLLSLQMKKFVNSMVECYIRDNNLELVKKVITVYVYEKKQ